MTTTSTTTAPARKGSVWDKVLTGLKINKKDEEVSQTEMKEPTPSSDDHVESGVLFGPVDFCGPMQNRPRQMSITTGTENNNNVTVHKRTASAPRSGSIAGLSLSLRRPSAQRLNSASSTHSRRGSKWWRGANESDEDAPPVPHIDRKFSIFGSHNPDDEAVTGPSPPASRRPSYVPRNAASSFLSTTSQKVVRQPSGEGLYEANRSMSVSGPSAAGPSKPPTQAHKTSLQPINTKVAEVRKDSHVGSEKAGMFSMAGICDIIEDVDAEKADEEADEAAVSPTSSKKVASIASESSARNDSAKGSIELKNEAQQDPSQIQKTIVA